MKSKAPEAQPTTAWFIKSRQRKRSEDTAIEFLKTVVGLTPKRRQDAIRRIRAAPRPLLAAKQIAAEVARRAAKVDTSQPDYSTVQELRAKIIRRDGVLDTPHALLLLRMDRNIATNDITLSVFDRLSEAAWGMPCVIPAKCRDVRFWG